VVTVKKQLLSAAQTNGLQLQKMGITERLYEILAAFFHMFYGVESNLSINVTVVS
jgi:hypothetical protein